MTSIQIRSRLVLSPLPSKATTTTTAAITMTTNVNTTATNTSSGHYVPQSRSINQHNPNVDIFLDANSLRTLADGVLDIPESEDRFFTLSKPEGDAILPLPTGLASIYVLKWANPTRIGAGAGAAYSLDVISDEPARARTRHLYITYMDEAGPSRCRVALSHAIMQLGPILYTAEQDARNVSHHLIIVLRVSDQACFIQCLDVENERATLEREQSDKMQED